MIYADYSFYLDSYFGNMFDDEDEFIRCAARASDYIDRITMNRAQEYMVLHPDDERVKKAVCACAEGYKTITNARVASATTVDGEIASESVGSHSVSYRSNSETVTAFEAENRKMAEAYLLPTGLLYRGIPYVHATYCHSCNC